MAVVALLEFVNAVFDPFGMSSAMDARAATVMQRVVAPFYSPSEGTAGQRAVTVVLIDQTYFDAIASEEVGRPMWPLPVRMLTRTIIQRIIDANPAALFVDMTFADTPREVAPGGEVDRRRSATELGETLRRLANRRPGPPPGRPNAAPAPVPVLLADAYVGDDGTRNADCPIRYVPEEDIARMSETTPTVRTALLQPVSKAGPVPPNLEMVDSSSITPDGYVLTPTATGPRAAYHSVHADRRGLIASPALALYYAYGMRCAASRNTACLAASAYASALVRTPGPDAAGAHHYSVGPKSQANEAIHADMAEWVDGTLVPRWGVGMTETMRSTFRGRSGSDVCRTQLLPENRTVRMWLGRATTYLVQMFRPLERLLPAQIERRCTYIDTISAAYLLDHSDLDTAVITKRFLKDRVVLLGASIPQVGDRFISPISGDLPGVYQHAVAIENLITSRGGYHNASGWRTRVLMVAITAAIVGAMTLLWERLLKAGDRRFGVAGQLLFVPLIYAVAMVALAAVTLKVLDFFDVPLLATLTPLITLHVLFFARWVLTLEGQLMRGLDRGLAKLGRSSRSGVRARSKAR